MNQLVVAGLRHESGVDEVLHLCLHVGDGVHGRQRGCLLDCLLQRGGFGEDFGDELGDVEDRLDEFGTHVLVEFAVFGVSEDGRVRHEVVERRDGAVADEFVDRAVRVLREDDFLLVGEVFAHVAYGRGHLQLEQADDAAALCVELFGFGGEDAHTTLVSSSTRAG